MLEHGGRLRAAAQQYNIPLADWLDLSAAINPAPYPVGDIPAHVWQRLPEDDDELVSIATAYYGNAQLLPLAGTQVAIQLLPLLMPPMLRVGMLHPSYNEHAHAWQNAGHHITLLTPSAIAQHSNTLDVLLLVNPNNPTGDTFTAQQLLHWHQQLAARGGWLIVDEAFIDAAPAESLAARAGMDGLVVLRSAGKFFGLAGARAGFLLAPPALRNAMREMIGPWSLSHPSRVAVMRALADDAWQQSQRQQLPLLSKRLADLLATHGLPPTGGCELFQWVQTPLADSWHRRLAAQGILVRHYTSPASLRFGLPASEAGWQKLAQVLASLALP